MKPLYKQSFSEAKRNGETEEYRESFRENIRCRDFLDNEIKEKFDGMYLPSECAENAVKEFGYDRTMWVIANTVLERDGDGRFHNKNREWAKSLNIPKENRNYEFALRSHSCMVDGLAGQVQEMYRSLKLFGNEHTIKSDEPQDYKGKLLVIRADVLKEECRTPENQLFLASGGFGCSPTSSGRKVYGQFLSDGEKTQFYRSDFVGIIRGAGNIAAHQPNQYVWNPLRLFTWSLGNRYLHCNCNRKCVSCSRYGGRIDVRAILVCQDYGYKLQKGNILGA